MDNDRQKNLSSDNKLFANILLVCGVGGLIAAVVIALGLWGSVRQYYDVIPALRTYSLCYAGVVCALSVIALRLCRSAARETGDVRRRIFALYLLYVGAYLLYRTICVVMTGVGVSRVLPLFPLAAIFAAGVWLLLFRPSPWVDFRLFYEWHSFIGIVLVVVLIVALLLVQSVFGNGAEKESLIPVTEENTPVHLFMKLRADITPEEVYAMVQEYDWAVTDIAAEKEDQKSFWVTVDADYVRHMNLNGAAMLLRFQTAGDEALASAMLSIKTAEGSALCYYDPSGGQAAFRVETEAGLLGSQTATVATPEEAVDIIYDVIYPESA